MIKLVSGGNRQGYLHALEQAFGAFEMPSKAALSKFRNEISFNFFKQQLIHLSSSKKASKNTWKGLRVYAIDGQHIELPRTTDLEKNNYKGRIFSDYRESYTLRMYASHCYDVLNGTSKHFEMDCFNDELHWAKKFIPTLESSSLTLYDRLYPTKDIMKLHCENSSYFLIKCRRKGVIKDIESFFLEKRRKKDFLFLEKYKLHLIKVRNPKTKKSYVFITNLPDHLRTKGNIRKLYHQRWEVEVSFKQLTDNQKMEQFHSKSLNGIKQEIYASLWLLNATNVLAGRKGNIDNHYERVNLKLIFNWLSRNIRRAINSSQEVFKEILILREKSKEKRVRYKRKYKRELKHSASPYKYNNTIFIVNGVKA